MNGIENNTGIQLLLSKSINQNQNYDQRNRAVERQSTGLSVSEKGKTNACSRCFNVYRAAVIFIGEDWLHLILLGVLMGIFSFTIDFGTSKLRQLHLHLFKSTETLHWSLQYVTWVLFSLIMVTTSSTLCHYIAPQAAGSGIPEMKTILRGVVLKEYLTCKVLMTKFIGLVLALGSDLPFGKEGPFVHIASMLARLLSKLVVSFQGIYENESRSSEMLAAACAVGVASTYGAPVGGVLFSIEVTSVFFPLRNYWRGFLSTVCSAITFRLLLVWSGYTDTVVAFNVTNFPSDFPFDPKELLFFALIGIACGFGGALFVWMHQNYVRHILHNHRIKRMMQKYYFVYPVVITVIIASLRCPIGFGKYFAGGMTPREAVGNLSCNFSWNDLNKNDTNAATLISFWEPDGTPSIFIMLLLFAINMFWMTFVANTIPVPCGVFIPVFVTGAAFGRLIGEALYVLFPNGVRTDGVVTKLIPGAYALVGATAFAGAVTHAISTSVIVVEMTGQINYILPLTLAVLLANAVCARLQPSIYDSIIQLKKLPYLPQISPTSSAVHRVYVADFCVRDVKFLSLCSTYRELRDLLFSMPKLKSFPLVDAPSSCTLLGSIRRSRLARLLDSQIGEGARRQETIARRYSSEKSPAISENEDRTPPVPTLLINGTGLASDQDEIDNLTKQTRFMVRKVRSCDTLLETPLTSFDAERCAEEIAKTNGENGANLLESHYHTISVEPSRSRSFLMALGSYMQELPQRLRRSLKRPGRNNANILMTSTEIIEWQNSKLDEMIDFERLKVDPAPFQLVEKTSLHKAHSLFWILSLNRAYVTCLGRLVGVVALRELREAIEKAQLHEITRPLSRNTPLDITNIGSPAMKIQPHYRRKSGRPSSLARRASTTTSASLIPGQAEAFQMINVSVTSSPDIYCTNVENTLTPPSMRYSIGETDSLKMDMYKREIRHSSVSLYENAYSELMLNEDSDDDYISYDSDDSTNKNGFCYP